MTDMAVTLQYFMISVFILVTFAIPIMICVYVYRDATRRGMNAAMWVLIVIFGQILGIIIYLIVRRDHPNYMLETRDHDKSTGKILFAGIFALVLLVLLLVYSF